MCGIAGICDYGGESFRQGIDHEKVLRLLKHRGPDSQTYIESGNCVLYHSRLEIIDPTSASNQPFCDQNENELLVYNGEVFNYRELGKNVADLKTSGDVEVLFKLLRLEGKDCLNKLNGFFAFGFYDDIKKSLLIGRDRFGVKPLFYYWDEGKFAFASELKPLLEIIGKQELNYKQVYTYFRLNYCEGNETIFKNIYRLLPGQCIEIEKGSVKISTWYKPARDSAPKKNDLYDLLEDAVKVRLHADVPLGSYLSGGLDSSIISALAIKHKPDLQTFSIGFEDAPYFDESRYSSLVAKHIGSQHHIFKLKEQDFIAHIDEFLNSIDEPFADSSAFNFYLLSKFTRQHVKVALSGDGADELFKGYNKHRALYLSENKTYVLLAKIAAFILSKSKSGRQGLVKNKMRQLKKFAQLSDLQIIEKLKLLASISDHGECKGLIKEHTGASYFDELFLNSESLSNFNLRDTFDIQTVLAGDMLVKADRFSMQHGIEIRNPFLDYRVVEFALNLDTSKKINWRRQKIILKETFKDLLPKEILKRPKKGFELPLQKWLSNDLRHRLEKDWLNKDKIDGEGILNSARIEEIKNSVFSDDPGDSAAKLWAVVVFEKWMDNFRAYVAF